MRVSERVGLETLDKNVKFSKTNDNRATRNAKASFIEQRQSSVNQREPKTRRVIEIKMREDMEATTGKVFVLEILAESLNTN